MFPVGFLDMWLSLDLLRLHVISPDIQRPLLAGPQGSRPRADAAVHHLLSQVVDLGLEAAVLWHTQAQGFIRTELLKELLDIRFMSVTHPPVCSAP